MWHLFKHETGKHKGKYDVAFVVKGKYKVGSNQGYNKKLDAIKCAFLYADSEDVQDDTLETPKVYFYYKSWDKKLCCMKSDFNPRKRYIPNSK